MSKGHSQERRGNIWMLGFVGAGLAAALGLLVLSDRDDAQVEKDENTISACAPGYKGFVAVTDEAALVQLGSVANEQKVPDAGPNSTSGTDYANLPGELACKVTIDAATGETEVVLLPVGMQVLGGPADLPQGLQVRSN